MRIERTSDAAGTEGVGATIASGLQPGDVVLVSGELGAGKTTLIRGACRSMGITEPIVSPTFTIGRRYAGRVPVSHLDLSRLDDPGNEDPGLLDDYVHSGAVAFVEWPTAAEPGLDATGTITRIAIRNLGGDEREIAIGGNEG